MSEKGTLYYASLLKPTIYVFCQTNFSKIENKIWYAQQSSTPLHNYCQGDLSPINDTTQFMMLQNLYIEMFLINSLYMCNFWLINISSKDQYSPLHY